MPVAPPVVLFCLEMVYENFVYASFHSIYAVNCFMLEWIFSNMHVGAGERTGLCGESLEAVCSVGEQQGFPADVYPYARAAALLLHAWPRLRRLAHHDGSAGAAGVRHRHPQTLALRSHRTQPGEQEPSQTTPPQVNQESVFTFLENCLCVILINKGF